MFSLGWTRDRGCGSADSRGLNQIAVWIDVQTQDYFRQFKVKKLDRFAFVFNIFFKVKPYCFSTSGVLNQIPILLLNVEQ
jgi:hypothetical protein